MSLRRPPRRTPAFLAANRADAQKSTGPRTSTGKLRSAANLLPTPTGLPTDFWERSLWPGESYALLAWRHEPEPGGH